jgi:3-deoxy-manno-octulosonate cytidylyltransferase (CMP-KDO synthetase)
VSKIIGLIPARFSSTRFPGKPLIEISGKSMIQRVYEQARKSKSLLRVIVATDDRRIEDCVRNFGGEVCMTSSEHPSGTDRCAEVVHKMDLDCDAIVNIQGDEPFIDPRQIDLLCSCFTDERTQIATLIKKISTSETLFNPNSPKVVIDSNAFAIYFSRHPIPYVRGMKESEWLTNHDFYQHVGIYGYSMSALNLITKLAPSSLEKAESLEQLRWLEHGFRIKTAVTDFQSVAIDTPEDLENILKEMVQGRPGF